MNKGSLRQEMKATLATISKEQYTYASKKIQEALYATKEWQQATIIGVTVSRVPEVSTKAIIEQAWQENKKIVVPKCFPADKSMEFYFLENLHDLETVYFGLKEPNPATSLLCEKARINLMLVPGVVFDIRGYRIGFGGGYYDRYLEDFNGEKISLAFEEQVKKEIPYDAYDIPVNKLITNEEIYECHTRK
ncbi:5-formyltetrahydrofolate cyclo-ligase [Sutcliffiella halmapala]|uniref:5-formyltetrahydrofolate cyclo-ligase n=1 Tax=Sutcliffiella halmapala TaxID=79882 RepID=UPI00099521BB|nr:5-formyltetrahydrofolate cyclo-ligase [Sutcliffiella halmapala]